MVFDGTGHELLIRSEPASGGTFLELRRLTPAAEWADGDAATGGRLLWSFGVSRFVSPTLTLDGSTPVVGWATGGDDATGAQEMWVTRLDADGNPLDLHDGAPGVNVYVGDPATYHGVDFPIVLGGAGGVPAVLYSVDLAPPTNEQRVRAIRYGL